MYQDGVITRRLPFEQSSEFIDDELPLPSFQEVFGFSVPPPIINKTQKRRFSGSEGMDPRALAKRLKLDDFEKGSKHDSGYCVCYIDQRIVVLIMMMGIFRRWTPEEHRLFLEGVMLYGKDWKKMQPLIKTRSLVQIRTHAQKVFKKIGLKRFEDSYDEKPARLPHSSAETAASAGNNNQTGETTLTGETKPESDEPDEKANENSATFSSTTEDRTSATSNPQRNSSVTASNDFRGYDMEVTDEEFNLVVQHLKNLGEIRGDDFSDEGEEGSINDHGRNNAKKQRAVASSASTSNGRNPASEEVESSSRPTNSNSSSNSFESSDIDSRPNQREDGETTDKNRSTTGNPPFIPDDDAQSQHLLQTLRQYLMPDNENNDGFSATEFF